MQKNTLKKIVINTLFFFLIISCGGVLAERPKLKHISDLRETAQLAKEKNLPILMMFGTDECPYCELLKEDFLIPMIISGHYQDKVIFREIHIAAHADLIDFSGNKITVGELSRRYGVTLFPTTVFIDSNGQPLVKNIIGITTPSLFGGTLDDHIDKALGVLRNNQNSE
ncbi:MAG: thioredoxin fold domain-containing protein [Gammaproteobacteria bacterium]|nr:thioredoxin fold domain-containing protein [Gammaproteobacteria bacterium]